MRRLCSARVQRIEIPVYGIDVAGRCAHSPAVAGIKSTGANYDNSGNLTYDTIHLYTWDPYGKLSTIDSSTCGTNGECVTYDALGRIVETSYNTAYTEIWYTQLGKVYMTGGTTPYYAYWPTPGNGTVEVNGNAVTFFYMHKDWLGNAHISSTIVNPTVVSDQAYAPYGEVYNKLVTGAGVPAQMFTGDTQDIIGGIFDTPSRELNASQGRWLSPDPAGQGWNQYAYPTNPNSATDPTGLYTWYDGAGNGGFPLPGVVQGSGGGCSSSCGLASGQVSFGNASVAADDLPRGIVSTTAWANGEFVFTDVIDTDGVVYMDTTTGVMPGPSPKPIEASDRAWDLLAGTFNAPGVALNQAVCGQSLLCSTALGVVLMAVGQFSSSLTSDIVVPEWVAITFAEGDFQTAVLQSDLTVYRADTYAFVNPGRFFGADMPASVADAEALYNIAATNPANQLNYVNSYLIPAGTSISYGPVAGGSGTQIWVSSTSGIVQTSSQLLRP